MRAKLNEGSRLLNTNEMAHDEQFSAQTANPEHGRQTITMGSTATKLAHGQLYCQGDLFSSKLTVRII